jgi:hypothetical protein
MKAFCCVCHEPVRLIQDGERWRAGRCRKHPNALRVTDKFLAAKVKQLCDGMRAAVEAATNGGKAFRDTALPSRNDAVLERRCA